MANRSHVYRVLEDANGVPTRGVAVTVKTVGGSVLADPLFVTDAGGSTLPNPFTTTDGSVEFYLDTPQRIVLQWRPPGAVQDEIATVDAPEFPAADTSGSGPALGTPSNPFPDTGLFMVDGGGNTVPVQVDATGHVYVTEP